MSDITKITGLKGATVAEQINLQNSMRPHPQMSGRGHGRLGKSNKTVPKSGPFFNRERIVLPKKRQDMLYFVREVVRSLRQHPPKQVLHDVFEAADVDFSTHQWAHLMVQKVQYFDCNEIKDYVYDNLSEMYPDPDVPPSKDAVLPAHFVGLYISDFKVLNIKNELDDIPDGLIMCSPLDPGKDTEDEEYGKTYLVNFLSPTGSMGEASLTFCGIVDIVKGTWVENVMGANTRGFFNKEENDAINLFNYTVCRMACGLIQTINTPSFVRQTKKDVSPLKRARFKKSIGRFSPDSWNMVSWNVGSEVEQKEYNEGSGTRQARHFRRGHWKNAQKDHPKSVLKDGRWMTYVHGYMAGHPAFGVKKNYHLPRKEDK